MAKKARSRSFREPSIRVHSLFVLWVFVSTASIAVAHGQQMHQPQASSKVWIGHEAEIERFLETAEVRALKDIGRGITKPKKATLAQGEQTRNAVFKPIARRTLKGGLLESYQAEIAAYRLDRLLGLGMVPPTVEREIEGKKGSVQLWVNNVRPYLEAERKSFRKSTWVRDMSRMKTFDSLLSNADRNLGNFLVDGSWNIILIDHSRSFLTLTAPDETLNTYPPLFDRELIEKLAALDKETLEPLFKGLLTDRQIKCLLKRRDGLLAHVKDQVKANGIEGTYF